MRIGIFSDTHANLEALTSVIKAYEKECIDRYICLGDTVGYGGSPNECADLVRATGGIGNKPLVVLSQSPDWNDPFAPDDVEPLIDSVTQRLAAQLLTLSSDSKLIVAKTAGHNIQADEPQLVIDAISDVVLRVRKSQQPLDGQHR